MFCWFDEAGVAVPVDAGVAAGAVGAVGAVGAAAGATGVAAGAAAIEGISGSVFFWFRSPPYLGLYSPIFL